MRLRTFALVSLPAALSFASASGDAQRGTITITGTVVDSVTQGAVLAVSVGAANRREHTTTDTLGAFRLTLPAGRSYVVTLEAPGYQPVGQIVDGTADADLGRVELPPMVYALQPVTATVSLLDQRVRASPVSVRVIRDEVLRRATESDLLQLVRERAGLRPTACNFADRAGTPGCVLVRGFPRRPVVYVDEAIAPGGLTHLELFRPSQIARVEVYQGGMWLAVYTRGFLEMMERTHRQPLPLFPTR